MNTETKHTPKFTQVGRRLYHNGTLAGEVNFQGKAHLNAYGLSLLSPEAENAGCDRCGTNDRRTGSKFCSECCDASP